MNQTLKEIQKLVSFKLSSDDLQEAHTLLQKFGNSPMVIKQIIEHLRNKHSLDLKEYQIKQLNELPDQSYKKAVNIHQKLDLNLLRPPFIIINTILDNSVIQDSDNYEFLARHVFNLVGQDNRIINNETRIKYPLRDIIKIQIEEFNIPSYFTEIPPNTSPSSFIYYKTNPLTKRICVSLEEIPDKINLKPTNIHEGFQYNSFFKTEALGNITKLTPILENGEQLIAPIKSITSLTLTLFDSMNLMYLPKCYFTATFIPSVSPTTFTTTYNDILTPTEIVQILDSTSGYLPLLNKSGYAVQTSSLNTFTLQIDTSSLIGGPFTCNIYRPNCRIQIPIRFTMLRPEISDIY